MLYRVKAGRQNSHSYPTEGHRQIHNQPSHLTNSILGKLRSAKQLILLARGFYLIGMLIIRLLLILTEAQDGYQ